jgi:gliding motility-associated-like protein
MQHVDDNVDASFRSYYYQVESIDSCDGSYFSGTARTILLSGRTRADFTNELTWNQFEIENGTVNGYTLYKQIGGSFTPLAALTTTDSIYEDDISNDVADNGVFCYRIDADFTLNIDTLGITENLVSASNGRCLEQRGKIYVPNAIVPNGINNIFAPVIVFGTEGTYSMHIFDRWGKVIFETTNINDAWNGTFKGNIVSQGVYAYLIQFTATNGQIVIKKGHVMVVR